MSKKTESRKREHIETVLGEDVSAKGITTGFERFQFDHVAVPEIGLDDVDLGSSWSDPGRGHQFGTLPRQPAWK